MSRNNLEEYVSVAICSRDTCEWLTCWYRRPLSKDTSTGREKSGKSGIPAAREAYGTSLYLHDLQPRINHVSVPQGVPVERPRARGTRERKGDDKSDRTRRIEKVAPVGPGNGIPVLDSAGNPRRYRVTKRRSAGTIVRAITTGDIGKTGRIYRILTCCVRLARENIFDRFFFIAL